MIVTRNEQQPTSLGKPTRKKLLPRALRYALQARYSLQRYNLHTLRVQRNWLGKKHSALLDSVPDELIATLPSWHQHDRQHHASLFKAAGKP